MRRFLLNIVLLTIATLAMADAVGTWKLYPSYTDITEVQYSKADSSEVFVLASGNLFAYYNSDKTFSEFMIEGASSATGTSYGILSSRDISHIAWCAAVKKLIIVYSDGMIDLLNAKDRSNPAVGPVVGLKETELFTDKETTSIYVKGQYAYLVTANHIVKVDVKEESIIQTYNTTTIADVDGLTTDNLVEPVALKYKYGSETVPDGPASNYCWRLYKHDGKIFSTAGNFSAGLGGSRRKGEVDYLQNNKWKQLPMPDDYQAANCMVFDPRDNSHFFVGGGYGLIEYRDNGIVASFDSRNSTLQTAHHTTSEDRRCLVTSMIYDANYNLWVMNGYTDPAIHKYSTSGEWTTFPHTELTYAALTSMDHQGVFISPTNGYLWWVHSYDPKPALHRYNYTNDVLSSITSFVNQDGVNLSPRYTYNVAEDQEGNIWIASYSGPIYLSKDNVLLSNPTFEQPKVNRNDGTGLADYLLGGIICRCIKFDAADRKWIGTSENGVYLISKDNQEQVANFTTANSPLLSNTVYDVLIDGETGIVYFATDKGICSYQSDVTDTYGELDKDNVYAYPNPVTPEFTGNITIMGLSEGCSLKIVNATGHVVHSGQCTGGSYTWNGCDSTGNRVGSGVYMVLVSNPEGDDGCVTKIAVIK